MTIYGEILDTEIELVLAMNNKLSSKDNGHLKGTAFEHSFRSLLAKFTPHNIDVSRGWILYPDGTQSEERDFLVYDKKKAPAFLFDYSTGIIPLLSILYDIQIKSSLSAKTIKDAYLKADRRIPYLALIGNKGKNLLEEYSKIDPEFYINPKIRILSSEEDGYYYFNVEKRKFGEIFSIDNLLQSLKDDLNINLKIDKESIPEKLTLNTHKVSDLLQLEITISQWINFRPSDKSLKCFIIGFSNTLFKENIGQYISSNDNMGIIKSLSILDHNKKVVHLETLTESKSSTKLQITPNISIKQNGDIKVSIVENDSQSSDLKHSVAYSLGV